MTEETVVVPGQGLEGHKFSASQSTLTSDRIGAGSAPLGEQLSETFSAVGLVLTTGESLSSKGLSTVSAGETFSMPGVVTVSHSASSDHLDTLDTLGSKLVLVTSSAVNIVLLGYEALSTNRIVTGAANKTLLMPLPSLVFHLLHPCFEHISTAVTSGCELCIITRPTVDPVSLGTKLFVH